MILFEKKLIMTNCDKNNNKFWTGVVNDDFSVLLTWGRVGNTSVSTTKKFSSEASAKKFINSKFNEKLKKGYVELKIVSFEVPINHSENLSKIAVKQIKSDNITQALITRLAKLNIHNILTNTTLTIENDSGLFKTPLGIVTDESITNARKLLDKMSNYVFNSDFKNKDYIKLLNEYLTIIPQRAGQRLTPQALYRNLDDIKKQNDILDLLQVSYNTYLENLEKANNSSTIIDLPKIFSCSLIELLDLNKINRISEKFLNTLNKIHSSSILKLKKVYKLDISKMSKDFEENSNKIGNIQELWHGTKSSNLLSILKSGLIVPPKSNPHVTGRMFGDGLYFSDQSTKALNYSNGFWTTGCKDDNCFMFLADVAMGKEYLAKSSSESFPKKGFDSTFAKANYSGVKNNEMIVYNTNQVNLKYLIEFTK